MSKLYIQQKVFKLLDHYPVTDENEQVVYQVDQEFRWFGHAVKVSDAQGQALFTIERELLTLLPRFKVQFSEGRSLSIKSRFSLFRHDIDIDPEDLGLNLLGNFTSHEFSLSQRGRAIGSIKKAWFSWGDAYELTVEDESLEMLFVAVVIAVDSLLDAASRRN